MSTKQKTPTNQNDLLKSLFKDQADFHKKQFTGFHGKIKKDIAASEKRVTKQVQNIHDDVESVKMVHADTHAETLERFTDIEEKLDTLLLDKRISRLERTVFGKTAKVSSRS